MGNSVTRVKPRKHVSEPNWVSILAYSLRGKTNPKDNLPSLRVLKKCGFTICGDDKGFSNARGVEVEEFMLELGAK